MEKERSIVDKQENLQKPQNNEWAILKNITFKDIATIAAIIGASFILH